MRASEGILGYGSGRYKLVGRAGMDDEYLHNGDGLEVCYRGRWLRLWVFFDGQGWRFEDKGGQVIEADLLGLPARR